MRVILLWGTVTIAFLALRGTYANNKCYEAKICIHDGKEKCARDQNGKVRRFLDACDIKEYNCLNGVDFKKVDTDECNDLPKIGEHEPKKSKNANHQEEVNESGDDEKKLIEHQKQKSDSDSESKSLRNDKSIDKMNPILKKEK